MKKNFTNQEAKDIILIHQLLSDKLISCKQNIDKKKYLVKANTDNLLNNNAFSKYVLRDCVLGYAKEEIPEDILQDFVATLFDSIQNIENETTLDKLINELISGINPHISVLKSLNNAVKWFFSSGSKKNEANQAYEYLLQASKNNYYAEVNELYEKFLIYKCQNLSNVLSDFNSRKPDYINMLAKISPDVLNDDSEIAEFKDISDKFSQLQNIANNAKSSVKQLEDLVKKLSERLIAAELLDMLKAVPIEELRREVSGLRYKALHENGYDTLADTFCANQYNLSSIYGISDSMAYDIKKYTAKYADQLKLDAKIKINADKKSKESSNLVLVLNAIKECRPMVDEIDAIQKRHATNAAKGFKVLKSLGNGVRWVFLNASSKKEIVEIYQYLYRLVNDEYADQIVSLTSRISSIINNPISNYWDDFERNSVEYFNILEEIVPDLLGKSDTWFGLPEELAREIQDECFFPDGLKCNLRRYQEWGVKYILHQERVLLGDEMGLGKTVQAIASMVSLRNTGATHFVVVCPASVVPNWCKEVTEKSKLRVFMIHGTDRIKSFNAWKKNGGVAVTNFETTGHLCMEPDYKFDMLVVDEAHYIKNVEAQRTQNVLSMGKHTKRMLFMTGTALENRVDEMIALIKVLQPSIARSVQNIAFISSAPQFRNKIAPVYYRRKREDVLTELPELIETKEWCLMSEQEERVYEYSVQNEHYMSVRRLSWNVPDLRYSSKAKRMYEIIKEAESEGRKIIVFSYFIETIEKIRNFLGSRCLTPINGSIPPQKRQEIINEFEKAPAGSVILAQIQAGGTGLNIQAASVVIMCEPQVKPSIENQAISRAYRMGQARNVLVYRLLCQNTIDEKMIVRLSEKQAQFDAFADKSVSAELTNQKEVSLDASTMGEIIKEEIERIKQKQQSKNER